MSYCEKVNPKCPGCGKEMTAIKPFLHVSNPHEPESLCYVTGFSCRCGWSAPTGNGKTAGEAMIDAYGKAMKRV